MLWLRIKFAWLIESCFVCARKAEFFLLAAIFGSADHRSGSTSGRISIAHESSNDSCCGFCFTESQLVTVTVKRAGASAADVFPSRPKKCIKRDFYCFLIRRNSRNFRYKRLLPPPCDDWTCNPTRSILLEIINHEIARVNSNSDIDN